jgi:uncharacterized membrane protein
MSRLFLWLAGVLVSVIAILAVAFGPYGILLAMLLAMPFVRRRDGRVALSGLLTGFGAIWLILLARQASSGGVLDNAVFWIAVGAVILLAGLVLLASVAIRTRSGISHHGATSTQRP